MLHLGAVLALLGWLVALAMQWRAPRLPTWEAAAVATLGAGALVLLLEWAAQRERRLLGALRQEAEHRKAAELALHETRRMAIVGQLTRGMAHDFNNHLTAVNSNIELLVRRLPPDAGGLTRLADAAIDGVRRAVQLTHHLLSFTRKQPADPEPLDLGRLVADMAELLRRTLGKGITVETAVAGGLWLAWADAQQIETALLEVALNARDLMPRGGGLTIEAANLSRENAAADLGVGTVAGDCVMLAVSDTSGGQAAGPATWPGEPIAGAATRVMRKPNQGVTVRMYLPRYVVQPPVPARAEPDAMGSDRPPTILLVEDDDDIRDVTAADLREMGYRVLEAPDAMEGFRLIADLGGIDLLFTDIGLPAGVDGRALADAARNLVPDLKVLFTTGRAAAAGDAGRGAAEGEAWFLPKPFSRDQLAAMLREALPLRATDPELVNGPA